MLCKIFLLFVATIVVVSALTDEEQFSQFKKDYNKVYANAEDEAAHFKNFQNTLRLVEQNEKDFAAGKVTHKLGINKFADLSKDEFHSHHTGLKRPEN